MRQFLKHFFLPRHTNNHRAKALHIDSLLCYVLLFAIFNLGMRIVHREFPSVLGYATDIRVDALLASTNAERANNGLNPLRFNATLSQAAAAKAQDMFANNYWAHNSPQGKTPWSFIVGSGYKYTIAGENLAKNFSTSAGVVSAWMASPTHRDNIVKPGYQDVGFAVVNGVLNGEETTLVVQMFGAGESPIAANPPVKTVVPVEAAVAEKPIVAQAPQLGEKTAQEIVPVPKSVDVVTAPVAPISSVLSNAFSAVTTTPMFNIPTVTRDIAFMFMGLIIGVLIIDGIVVSRKKMARIAGHNIAHILFFVAFFIALTMVRRGVLL
jgi:hypothetical protein